MYSPILQKLKNYTNLCPILCFYSRWRYCFTIKDFLNLFQQTILLVEETNNYISYHKWLSAPAAVMKSFSKPKSMIKDKNRLLESSGKELFGNDFHVQVTTVRAQMQSKELLLNVFLTKACQQTLFDKSSTKKV